jgi:VanZ family protein
MELFARKAWWLLTATWAVMIFDLSRGPYSSVSSARFISTVFDWLSISILPQNLGLLNNLLRKSAHLTEYAVLAAFLYNSLKPAGNPFWSRIAAIWALLASASYSITDELHQLFVPGRHASLFDCLIDTAGAFLGLFVLSKAIVMLRRKQTGVVAKTAQAFHEMG